MSWGARSERDQARSERDAARRGLKAARSERDAALESLARAQAERDAALQSLTTALEERDLFGEALLRRVADSERASAERDSGLLRKSEELINEVREMRAMQRAADRRAGQLHRQLMTDIQALQQLLTRYSPEARLPPVAGWALSPSGLLAVADLIETTGARTVVECGSGTSTLWIGYALKRLGRGRVIALDHLPEYAEKTRAIVAAHGLEEFVDVRLAPLAPRQTPRGEFSWYTFDTAELTEQIDVLLVDGPPQATGRHARYPALPVFVSKLAAGAVVVADDTDRPDEAEMLEFWLAEEPRLTRAESPGSGIEVLRFLGGPDDRTPPPSRSAD